VVADQIGIAVVILAVLDCGDVDKTRCRAELYAGYGFQSVPSMLLHVPTRGNDQERP
jgi:hypothetical protein